MAFTGMSSMYKSIFLSSIIKTKNLTGQDKIIILIAVITTLNLKLITVGMTKYLIRFTVAPVIHD